MKNKSIQIKEEILRKIENDPIIPYPHQDDGEYYPEFDKYGEVWSQIKTGDDSSDYVRSYLEFWAFIKSIEKAVREETIRGIEKYFDGLIIIPDPQATKEKLIASLENNPHKEREIDENR